MHNTMSLTSPQLSSFQSFYVGLQAHIFPLAVEADQVQEDKQIFTQGLHIYI